LTPVEIDQLRGLLVAEFELFAFDQADSRMFAENLFVGSAENFVEKFPASSGFVTGEAAETDHPAVQIPAAGNFAGCTTAAEV